MQTFLDASAAAHDTDLRLQTIINPWVTPIFELLGKSGLPEFRVGNPERHDANATGEKGSSPDTVGLGSKGSLQKSADQQFSLSALHFCMKNF